MSYCPKCEKEFTASGGFCPFDGTTLRAGTPSKAKIAAKAAISAVSARDNSGTNALANLKSFDYASLIGVELDKRYKIEKTLGDGGMGVVFLARHMVIDKPVAIKVLKREVARDKSIIKRFVQEAQAASKIGHPNIVDVTDFGTTPDGLTYQVMEFIDGDTLNQVIRKDGPLSQARCLPIVAQMARALGAAHSKGIVHRDLKPDNIFLIDRDGRHDFVKIVDFGIAKVQPTDSNKGGPRLTKAGSVFGTPEYMAPEQAAGKSDVDRRVDIYALGTILFEMLTGRVPLKGDSTIRTIAMQILDECPPPKQVYPDADVSPELEAVLMKALAKKPADRHDDMKAFLEAIETVAGKIRLHQPLTASTSNLPPVSGPQVETLVDGPDTEVASGPPTAAKQHADDIADAAPTNVLMPPDPVAAPRPAATPVTAAEPAGKKRPPTFDPIAPDTMPDIPIEPKRRGWIVFAAVILAFAGIGTAVALILSSSGKGDDRVATGDPIDASIRLQSPPDADLAEIPVSPIDAAVSETAPDAGKKTRGPSRRRADAGTKGTVVVGRGEDVSVRVTSVPSGANLYEGTSFVGTSKQSGVTFSRPRGSVISVKCEKPGYHTGKVKVVFSGDIEIIACTMRRRKKCIPGVKNPFDDCPE